MSDLLEWVVSQEDRQKSFKYWPFKRGPCNPEKMAQAGFYSDGKKSEPDLAKCYVCLKELDGWEKDDDPWSEHKKHAPQCPFVLLNKTPVELTTKDLFTLEIERMKKILQVKLDTKVKFLMELKQSVETELETSMNKGKENRKRKTSKATTKRSSRK